MKPFMNKTLNILMSALLIAALDLSAKKIIIENDEGASIYYTITRGNASVTSSDGTPYSGDIKLPEYVEYEGDHYKVTRIATDAFKDCSDLTSISLPESLETIGSNAFYGCSSLTSITFPPSLTSIGKGAFESCSLSDFTLPQGVTAIYDNAFARNRFKKVDIPDWVTYIGKQAFAFSHTIETVIIPVSVKSIGDEAFMSCRQLHSLAIPDGKDIKIGKNIVGRCGALSEIITPGSSCNGRCLVVDGTLKMFAPFGIDSFAIPAGVTSIGSHALADNQCLIEMPFGLKTIEDNACSGIRQSTVVIPGSVEKIGAEAFHHSNIVNIYIPESVKEIGERAFGSMRNHIDAVTVNIANPADIKCPDNIFKASIVKKLYVPLGSKRQYASMKPWSDCGEILEMEPGACALPEILLVEGKLKIVSDTEGSEIHTSIVPEDCRIFNTTKGEAIELTGQYDITAYACRNDKACSSHARAVLIWDNIVSNINDTERGIAPATGKMMLLRFIGRQMELSGCNAGEEIEVTDADNKILYRGITSVDAFLIPAVPKLDMASFVRVGDRTIRVNF